MRASVWILHSSSLRELSYVGPVSVWSYKQNFQQDDSGFILKRKVSQFVSDKILGRQGCFGPVNGPDCAWEVPFWVVSGVVGRSVGVTLRSLTVSATKDTLTDLCALFLRDTVWISYQVDLLPGVFRIRRRYAFVYNPEPSCFPFFFTKFERDF